MADFSNLRSKFVPGVAAAGNLTVTGVKAGDRIVSVNVITLTEGTPNTLNAQSADLTSEFKVTADNTINNTGGTITGLNKIVHVIWEAVSGGRTGTRGTGRSYY